MPGAPERRQVRARTIIFSIHAGLMASPVQPANLLKNNNKINMLWNLLP
jgi:hypothetical protein